MATTELPLPALPEAHHEEPSGGIVDYLTTVDHKKIGLLYIFTAFAVFLAGGLLALLVRWELASPGLQVMGENTYNQVFTMHGTLMIFLFAAQVTTGLGNYLVPLQIGAADVAFPRANAMSYWLYLFGVLIVVSSFFVAGGPAAVAWTAYAPLSTSEFFQGTGMDLWIIGLAVVGVAGILGAVNLVTTIFRMRMPGMTMFRMPLFTWGVLVNQLLILFAFPPLTVVFALLFLERNFGAEFFDPTAGGSPLLYQHIFWFFGHPEVYIIILPIFGIISEVIPVFSRKPLFGYQAMVYAVASIAFLSFIVWAHHMFSVGMPLGGELFFMYATMLIAIPTGVKVFNWVSTMWGGSMTFETPMLFAIAFVILFTIGGFSGVMCAIVPADFQYQDTYFVVAHFHYVLVTGAIFAIMASVYYWLPKWCGNMYSEKWGKIHFWSSVISVNVLFFPQHFLGLAGMPRRIPDYNVAFADFNMISSIGGFWFGASQLIFVGVIIHAVYYSKNRATTQVWEGAHGLEWTVPSPAPYHTFTVPPVIRDDMLAHGDVTH